MRKYRRPATDPTFLRVSEMELLVEYVEDALESGALKLGADGQVLRSYTLADGTEVMQTGDPVIDRMEQEYAERVQRDIERRQARGESMTPIERPPRPPEGAWYDDEDLLK